MPEAVQSEVGRSLNQASSESAIEASMMEGNLAVAMAMKFVGPAQEPKGPPLPAMAPPATAGDDPPIIVDIDPPPGTASTTIKFITDPETGEITVKVIYYDKDGVPIDIDVTEPPAPPAPVPMDPNGPPADVEVDDSCGAEGVDYDVILPGEDGYPDFGGGSVIS
ncbi:MAG: hypothetical protein HYZ90_05610 [Candidatus Omnitrophica bacterium]|nr:hypothetical protein [Candidatus Omnitrophota bacterium]